MSNLKARDKMRFTVNMLGFKKTYDMSPEDIVRNVAYNMAGLYENEIWWLRTKLLLIN